MYHIIKSAGSFGYDGSSGSFDPAAVHTDAGGHMDTDTADCPYKREAGTDTGLQDGMRIRRTDNHNPAGTGKRNNRMTVVPVK